MLKFYEFILKIFNFFTLQFITYIYPNQGDLAVYEFYVYIQGSLILTTNLNKYERLILEVALCERI